MSYITYKLSQTSMTYRTIVLVVPALAACASFSPFSPEPTPQETRAQEQQELEAKIKRLSETCAGGDDRACGELLENPQILAGVMQEAGVPEKRERAVALLRRACAGGNDNTCRAADTFEKQEAARVAQEERRAEHEAGLRLVVKPEVDALEIGWTMEQVVEALGQPCELVSRDSLPGASGNTVERSTHRCRNSDGTGVVLTVTDGGLSNVAVQGPLPE